MAVNEKEGKWMNSKLSNSKYIVWWTQCLPKVAFLNLWSNEDIYETFIK